MDLKKTKLINLIFPLAALVIIAAFWIIIYRSAGSEYIFPSIGSVLKKTADYIKSGFFWQSFFGTILRVLITFLISSAFALVLGAVGYAYPITDKIVAPFIKIMISAPTVAIMVIFNMLLINSKTAPVMVALTIIFPMTYSSVKAAFRRIDPKLTEMAKIYKVPLKKRIFSLIVPSVIPYLTDQAGTIISFTLKITVSAEIIACTYKSLGGLLQQANVYIDMAGVMAMTVISVITAIILEFVITLTVKLFKRRKGL